MPYEHLVAGLLGGVTSTLVLHPLDLLKVRFAVADGQSTLKKDYKHVLNAFSSIVRDEGFKGLYKGVAPNCIGAGTAWGLYFFFYNSVKKQMEDVKRQKSLKAGKTAAETDKQAELGILHHVGAGACAGILTTTITNPIWVVKTRLCLQYGTPATTSPTATLSTVGVQETLPAYKRYSGTWDALMKVWKYEGISGLYKGFVPGLLSVSHGSIQLAVYEEMKTRYQEKYNVPKDEKLGWRVYLTCALFSKFLAAGITYPCQVIRSRLQDQYVNYDGVIDVVKRTWKYESYRGFYKGFSAYALHVTPNICIVFLIYETVTNYCGNSR